MSAVMEDRFESLESAHDFVSLLVESVVEAKQEVERDVHRESTTSRRVDALRLALYDLEKLELHVNRTSRLLNDLRTLRRLLFEERTGVNFRVQLDPVQIGGGRDANTDRNTLH